mgnify:CR=1 FL=1
MQVVICVGELIVRFRYIHSTLRIHSIYPIHRIYGFHFINCIISSIVSIIHRVYDIHRIRCIYQTYRNRNFSYILISSRILMLFVCDNHVRIGE